MTDSSSILLPSRVVDVLCMGEIVLEFVPLQSPNVTLEQVQTWQCDTGGAPANVAVALQRLGHLQASFVGCVGPRQEPFANKIKQTLQQNGVDTTFLFQCSDASSLVFGAVWDDGRKDLQVNRGADRQIRSEWITPDMFEQTGAKCFHYGSITLIDEPGKQAQLKAMQLARSKGLLLSYDPNYRPTLWPDAVTAHKVMFDALSYAHMVKISEEEFEVVTGHADLQTGIQAAFQQGVELVIVSRGRRGALCATGNAGTWVESPALPDSLVDIVETTGAGDALLAAMLTRLLPEFEARGGTFGGITAEFLQEALDYSIVVAGLTCTKPGAIPALPTAAQVEQFLTANPLHHRRQQAAKEEKVRYDKNKNDKQEQEAKKLASMIDHTFLKPFLVSDDDVKVHCQQALDYGFATVAVNPALVQQCCQFLHQDRSRPRPQVKVGAAIGFPLGQTTPNVKVFETQDAINKGATEIDMVLNIRELQRGNLDLVRDEIQQVLTVCRRRQQEPTHQDNEGEGEHKICCKVILETCFLTTDQIVTACQICRQAGVDFVKTSTGMGTGGATVEHVKLMRQAAGPTMGVKASGGIADLSTARAMIVAGATRIGTSHGVAILKELLVAESSKS